MNTAILDTPKQATTQRYAKCIKASRRIRWDIDRDLIRGRQFDFSKKFLPDGLSKVGELAFLNAAEMRFMSQIQGRTYANMFALLERFIGAKTADLTRDHSLGDQLAFKAPEADTFVPQPKYVAGSVLGKGTWAVLALTLDIELFSQAHYRSSIEPDTELSDSWKDVFLFHWKEEQHAARSISQAEQTAIRNLVLKAYRWQYIATGVQEPRYGEVLEALMTTAQMDRIGKALTPILTQACE